MPDRRRGRPPHPDRLTPAERRVLEELRKGGTNAEIAVRIGIGPETVKTHISNMLAKLHLDDRQQLAAWREEDAPRRRWLLAPFLLRPLVAVGVVAGVAVVIVIILVLLGLVRGEQEPLYLEGVGDIEGPVAVFLVEDIVDMSEREKAELADELGVRRDELGHERRYRYRAAALDLGTGERWFLSGISDQLALAGTQLVAWTEDHIHLVALDGEVETVLFQPDRRWTFSAPIVSPDGSMLAFTLSPPIPRNEADSIIVLDILSGSEVLRVSEEDIRLEFIGDLALRRWSTDGEALLVAHELRDDALQIILTLEGDHYVFPDEPRTSDFSPDLRHAIHGRLVRRAVPTDQGGDGDVVTIIEALTVIEISTGRILATVTAEEGHELSHQGGPLSGHYFYDIRPYYSFEGSVSQRNILELATGKVMVLAPDSGLAQEALLEYWRARDVDVLANWGCCYESASALDACDATVEAFREVRSARNLPSGLRWELVGFIWLD